VRTSLIKIYHQFRISNSDSAPGCRCRQSLDDDDACECPVWVRQSRPLIRSLSSDAAGPDVNLNTPGLLQLTTLRGHLQPVPTPISRAQRRRTPHH